MIPTGVVYALTGILKYQILVDEIGGIPKGNNITIHDIIQKSAFQLKSKSIPRNPPMTIQLIFN
jgi:hypothetical protein